MEKKRKWRFSKVISMLLIVAMFSNEIIGETGLAWAVHVSADRTDLRRVGTLIFVAAVAALPLDTLRLLEYLLVLDII